MLIKKEIILELDKMEIVENPCNYKGKYAAYHFRTVYPSSHQFFTTDKPFRDEFTAVWGNIPSFTLYRKDYKALEKLIYQTALDNFPLGFPKDKHLITSAYLIIGDYRSPKNDRAWKVAYIAETYKQAGLSSRMNGFVDANKDALSRILANITPDQFTITE